MAPSIGAQLKHIRESQGISLETISQKTHISMVYLKAIEINDQASLPSKVQLRGFLRLYANVLGVNIDALTVGGYHLTQDTSETEDESETTIDTSQTESEPGDDHNLPPVTSEVEAETSIEIEPVSNSQELPQAEESFFSPFGDRGSNASNSLFENIGQGLKQRRELLSISIKDVFESIHIREEYIIAIESGQFGQLPSPVQGKGMLVNYASFLSLDIDTVLSKYTDALQMQHSEKQKEVENRSRKPARELSTKALKLKTFFSLDLLIILGLFFVIATFVIWGANRIIKSQTPLDKQNELPGVADVLLATPTRTPRIPSTVETQQNNEAEDELADQDTSEEIPLFTPAPSNEPINLVLIPRQRLWVRVTSDEKVAFQGRLIPGNAYDFYGQNQVEILTGNAGSLQIIFNDKDIGSSGLTGQVVSLSFTESGLELPATILTPIIIETPTGTPTSGDMSD